MFSKWFKRKSVPSNDGNIGNIPTGKHHYVKAFELELSNMEDTPVYELKHQLSIGSEIGNIVIADPSVSPRHATFIVQQEVVSVIDHGSIAGTFINGTKLTPGKYVIVEESDTVRVGDLEIKLIVGTVSAPIETIPEIPGESKRKDSSEPPTPNASEKKGFDAKNHLKKLPKKKDQSYAGTTHSANAVVRVLAVLCDLILSYSILIVLMPFDEFREFTDFVPTFIGELIGIEWSPLWNELTKDYDAIAHMIQDGYEFFSSTLHIVPLLIIFVINRVITTALMGVSLSEGALGIRPDGNKIWARIGGVLRVLIGFITWPFFIILDITAIVSRKTFKELITYTNTFVPSKFLAILGIIFYLPLVVALTLIAPLIQGFEPPEPITISDKVEQRVKARVSPGEVVEEPVLVADRSVNLKLELSYDPAELSIIPQFQFEGKGKKTQLKNSLIFYQKDLQRQVEFEVFKYFDFQQLIGIGLKGNFFLYDKYSLLHEYVYSIDPTGQKTASDPKAQTAFANQVIQFTQIAFSISESNALEIMENETPLLKGLIDYKSAFLSLIEYKDFSKIGFIKVGNIIFMKISYLDPKPFDLIIPLVKGQGRIFKVTYDKKKDLSAVISKFYKFNLHQSNWLSARLRQEDTLSPMGVFDLFSNDSFKAKLLTPEFAQSFYGYFFETCGAILKKGDLVEIELLKAKLENIPKLIESIPAKEVLEGKEDTRMKLLQNFKDILDALQNNNLEYFGVSQSAKV